MVYNWFWDFKNLWDSSDKIYNMVLKPKKVLVVAMKYLPASGGTATYAYNMALGLHKLGYNIMLLAPRYRRSATIDFVTPFKIKRLLFINERNFEIVRIILCSIQIFYYYLKFKPDIIWATSFSGARALGLLTNLKCIYIATIHGGGIHRRYPSKSIFNKITDWLGLKFMHRAEKIVTVSNESKKIFIRKLPYDDIIKKIVVIYNGIDFDKDKFLTSNQSKELLPEFKNKKVILTVGRLIKAKGHDIVIKAIRLLIKKYPDIIYVIVGEGPERKNIEKLVFDEGLENNVFFAGYVDNKTLEIYYGLCDIFVMAGRWTPQFVEGFGLVFIEAGIRGKVVIGTRIGGIPEAILENKTGFIVEPEDPFALSKKIDYLLKNTKIRKNMGDFAKKYINEHFSDETMANNNSF